MFGALAGANVSRVEIFLPLVTAVGVCQIGVHTHPDMPSGPPSIGSLIDLPVRGGWVTLPPEWGTWFRDNPTGGIGVHSGAGLNKWRGVGQDSQSGWIRFAGIR